MLIPGKLNIENNRYIKTANKSFENLDSCEHLESTLTEQNFMHGDIKSTHITFR
jgi:hypothetical protein